MVGGKLVAEGDLVIINDRFGVKISKVNDVDDSEPVTTNRISGGESQENNDGDEEFDYSDFEVEGDE